MSEFGPARPAVKVCCISNADDARLAIAVGAHALGLVSAMPSRPGVIDEALIARIAAEVPAPVRTFLLTRRQRAAGIVAQYQRCRPTTLQLVDDVPADELARLRDALPAVRLVQVIHVTGEASFDKAVAVTPRVDAILLDSGNPALAVKPLGGTGRTHRHQPPYPRGRGRAGPPASPGRWSARRQRGRRGGRRAALGFGCVQQPAAGRPAGCGPAGRFFCGPA